MCHFFSSQTLLVCIAVRSFVLECGTQASDARPGATLLLIDITLRIQGPRGVVGVHSGQLSM